VAENVPEAPTTTPPDASGRLLQSNVPDMCVGKAEVIVTKHSPFVDVKVSGTLEPDTVPWTEKDSDSEGEVCILLVKAGPLRARNWPDGPVHSSEMVPGGRLQTAGDAMPSNPTVPLAPPVTMTLAAPLIGEPESDGVSVLPLCVGAGVPLCVEDEAEGLETDAPFPVGEIEGGGPRSLPSEREQAVETNASAIVVSASFVRISTVASGRRLYPADLE
jgi:hypothetical protein